jgi:hypothetical protein
MFFSSQVCRVPLGATSIYHYFYLKIYNGGIFIDFIRPDKYKIIRKGVSQQGYAPLQQQIYCYLFDKANKYWLFYRNILILNTIQVQKPQKQATLFAIYSIYLIYVPIYSNKPDKYIRKASPLGLKYSGSPSHLSRELPPRGQASNTEALDSKGSRRS